MTETEKKALISLLGDTDHEVVSLVEQKILSLGEGLIPFLEQEWESSFHPETQKRIEDIIHVLQFDLLRKRLTNWKETGGVDLLEGLWLVATYQFPDLDLVKIRSQIEQIYYETWLEFKTEVHAFDQVKVINYVLFNKLKFSANNKNFHSAGNSMINIVLENKKGNPILLCCVYLLVAQKMKLPIYGVNLPNMFILTYKTEKNQFYINAFNKGIIFTRTDIEKYIQSLKIEPLDMFYNPCTNLDILRRVLRNLIVSFEKTGDVEKVDEIKIMLSDLSDPNGSV